MTQKINRVSPKWFWIWIIEESKGKPWRCEKLKIEKYYEVIQHQGFTFILHKPKVKTGEWKKFLITEIRTGTAAVQADTLEEVRELWEVWSRKADKKHILICIAKAIKTVKKQEKEWKESQLG